MLVNDVIIKSANLLGNSEVSDYLSGITDEISDSKEIDEMVVATNMAISNISANYINVCDRVSVKSRNNLIYFSDISDVPIIQTKKVLKSGVPVRFRVHNDCIEVGDGEYEIVFSYFPNMVTINDEINYFPQLNELVFAYAVVAEYLFLKGQIDDAYMWDKRFKSSLLSIRRPSRNVVLPKRRWW